MKHSEETRERMRIAALLRWKRLREQGGYQEQVESQRQGMLAYWESIPAEERRARAFYIAKRRREGRKAK